MFFFVRHNAIADPGLFVSRLLFDRRINGSARLFQPDFESFDRGTGRYLPFASQTISDLPDPHRPCLLWYSLAIPAFIEHLIPSLCFPSGPHVTVFHSLIRACSPWATAGEA